MSETEAAVWISTNGFRPARPGTVGVELEWLVLDATHPGRPALDRVCAALCRLPSPLPGGGRISFEPGGQVELSSAPARSLASCLAATRSDLRLIQDALSTEGIWLHGRGLDLRAPVRVVDLPRYAALERHYDLVGQGGRTMMCNTASVQVCVEAGDDSSGWTGRRRRWWLANALGPVLIAMFANSPGPRRAGWRSARQVLRFQTDPSRTGPMPLTLDPSVDPAQTWARYALDALVVGVCDGPGPWTSLGRLRMRDWLRGHGPRPVRFDDLKRHVKTVIPPVRPCGYLEIRMIDAQPGDGWVVPVAVVAALLDDAQAAAHTGEMLRRLTVSQRPADWVRAARAGLADPGLARAATACLDIALPSLRRSGVPAWVRDAVAAFADRYTRRRRSPADDLDQRHASGARWGSGPGVFREPGPARPPARVDCRSSSAMPTTEDQ